MIKHASPINSNFEEDMRYTVQVHKLIMELIGVWPTLEKSWCRGRFLKKFLNAVTCFLLSFNLVPWALFMFLIMETFKARVKMLGALCFYTMVPAMYCMLVCREDRIRECVRHVEEDWRNVRDTNDRRIMLENARAGRIILIYTVLFLFISGFAYRILPIIRGNIVVNENLTIRPLTRGYHYVLFDAQQSPAYEIVFSINCLTAVITYVVTSSVCGLTALFAMHACGQLKMLSSWLEKLTSDDQSSRSHVAARRLAAIVAHHVRIHRFLHQIQSLVGVTCFIEIIGSTLILCLLGYYVITGWERNDAYSTLMYAIMLVSFTFNIFILCYIGEILNTQGNKVNTTCCTIDWYCLPSKEARYLILAIIMASYPTKITAMKVIDLSFSSFGTVVRTAIAYLNLLRTVVM